MKEIQISRRLQSVAAFVQEGKRLADVGCDHGYIPIYLLQKKKIEKAIAMDINQGPIESAIKNIENYGLSEKIQAIKSNGLEKLEPEKADTIIIAGMGGELIVNILENGLVKLENCSRPVKELVLSPHKRGDLVRKYLEEHKWHITDEKMLIDMNKFYTIIKAEKGQESYPYSETELLYGRILLDRQDATLKKYLDKENAKFQKIKQKMIENQSKDLLEVEKILEYNRVGRESYD